MPRAAGKGKPGSDINVSVDIDIDKEIIEEYKEKDIWLGGIPGLLSERRTAITRAMVLSPEAYEEMRDDIDTKGNANVKTDVAEFGRYHGAWIYSNVHQPEGIEIIAMCTGAITEPIMADEYQAKQIELSNAYAIGMSFHYGCKVVMPDLIYFSKKPGATGASLDEEIGGANKIKSKRLL